MTAIKTAGMGDNFYVDGFDLSGDTNSLSRVGGGPAAIEQTDITQGGHARAGGLLGGEITWVSYFDKQANQAHAVLGALPRSNRSVSYLRGTALGSSMASMLGKQINYDPNRANDGSLTVGVSAQNDSFPLEWGRNLTGSATTGIRTDTTATNGTGVDDLTSTAFGAQFYLHVFGLTGTSVTVKIQDSADNATFADLTGAAFVAATGRGSQRIALALGSTVRRYLRVVSSGTFTNAQFAVNAIRNVVAVTY